MKNLYKVALTLIAVSYAHADDIRLGQPAYGGNGCPGGSVSAVLSEDEKTLSVLFDSFTAEAGAAVRKSSDRKSCNVAIPLHIPSGISISIIGVDYRGFNDLPAGASSTMTAEYFLANSPGPRFVQQFRGPQANDFLFHNDIAAIAWTPCQGLDTNLRVNAAARVVTNRAGDSASMTVDSADITAGIIYRYQFRRCW